MPQSQRAVAVIGGGSAGVSAVAALATRYTVWWFDYPTSNAGSGVLQPFTSGELARYQRVPANTKVEKLTKNLLGNPLLAQWVAQGGAAAKLRAAASPLAELQPFDPSKEGWVGLDVCGDYFDDLTAALLANPAVNVLPERVAAVKLSSDTRQWEVQTEGGSQIATTVVVDALVLATGAVPRRLPLPPANAGGYRREISLLTALDPERLRAVLANDCKESAVDSTRSHRRRPEDTVVALVGNSHSAMVVLQHLRTIQVQAVRLLCRRPVRHAEWLGAPHEDYKYTMSGLKGQGSVTARQLLPPSPQVASGRVEVVEIEDSPTVAAWSEALDGCDVVIQAVGFDATPLPALSIDGVTGLDWSADMLEREPHTSQLHWRTAAAPSTEVTTQQLY